MKIKEGFLLKQVADHHIVIPVGSVDFDGMITLNETAVFLWELLSAETTFDRMMDAFLEEYQVSREVAERDLAAFLKKLRDAGILDE